MSFTPPSEYYRGPITGIEACYGYPYMADDHCASCGSTKVSKPSHKNGIETFRCDRCRRVTSVAFPAVPDRDARYDILKYGHVEKESLTRDELDDSLWDVIMDLDAHYFSEKARDYYGAYYDELCDNEERFGDGSYQEEINDLEADVPWVNKCMALNDGYVNGLEVGQEYNLPDFPVTVVRVADANRASANRRTATAGRPTPSKPKTSSRSVKTRKAPAKASKPKAPAKKAPARKPTNRRY